MGISHLADDLVLAMWQQGAFEGNPCEFHAKDFLLKPPIQFVKGLDYLALAARCRNCNIAPCCRLLWMNSNSMVVLACGTADAHVCAGLRCLLI